MMNLKKVMIICVFFLVACQEGSKDTKKETISQDELVSFSTENEKVAYAIGSSMARYMQNSLEQQLQMGIDLDNEYILAGMSETLHGQAQMDEEELTQVLMNFEKTIQVKMAEKQKEQIEKNAKAEKEWLDKISKEEGIVKTDSGLMYKVVTKTSGDKPKAEDTVTVHYHGLLSDGTVFDSSVDRGETVSFPLDGVIPGWTEGLQLMSVGSKYVFYIPSSLAYGEQGAGGLIQPNTPLEFEVELFAINGEPETQEK